MLTVLPVAGQGISYGVMVLENLVKRNEENVVAIIQIGGQADSEHPTSSTSFIVLMMSGLNFTAFVSDRGTMPEVDNYSGTGSTFYHRFRDFMLAFQGEETLMTDIFSDSNREVNQCGLQAKCMGFSWFQFFSEASVDLDYNQEELEKQFSPVLGKGMDWTMNIYRLFLINAVFTQLFEVIK